MLCRDEDFQFFLGVDNEDAAADKLCKHCGIESRTELNGNANAKIIFDKLVASYANTKVIDDPF